MEQRILKVGAAKRCVSPTADMLPQAQSFANMKYEAVREGEDINVRAIVVDNGEKIFLFEAFEIGNVPAQDKLRKRIEDTYSIKQGDMLLTGTHNHSAPHPAGGPDRYGLGAADEIMAKNAQLFTDMLVEQGVAVIGDAMQNMKPAKFGFGEGKSYININRDELFDDGYWMQGKNWEGCSDKTLAVLKFTDYDGNLIAAVLNYAVHSITSFCAPDADGKLKVTCDFPGIASKFVEEYYDNKPVVLWQSGAAGNQNPHAAADRRFDKNGTMYLAGRRMPGASYETGISIGQQHGIDALRALKNTSATKTNVKISTVDRTVYFPGQKFPEGVDRLYHRLMVDNLLVSRGYFQPGEKYEKKLVDMIPTDDKVPMKSQLILFGDTAIYAVACELYNEIAMLCKEKSPFKNTMITTIIGEPNAGYILDDASKGHKVFQSFGMVREGESNGIVVNNMLEMFDEAMV